MSAVFKSPKQVNVVTPTEVVPEVVDDNEIVYELEKKRKKKMGAISQLLAPDRAVSEGKRTLGE